ncbi:MAG: AraC family transcriptional regulator [Pseudomonadota bacterium]
MKRRIRVAPSLNVHRLAEGAQLWLSDSDTVLLVVRGACAIRSARQKLQRVEAGALLLRQTQASPLLDRRVARALALLQAEPGKPWTVERLARAVGLSRAAFARRFAAVSGRSPGRFLTELRLALAASLLESTDDSLAELAARVGYASEFAFSRAFKREHGVAPGVFRRSRAIAHSGPVRLAA